MTAHHHDDASRRPATAEEEHLSAYAAWLDREPVVSVYPPLCERCDTPLTTQDELNRRIDLALDLCQVCWESDIEDDCSCVYGWYLGGDPRHFEPDGENTEPELVAWRTACEAWEQGKAVEPAPEEHGPRVGQDGRVSIGERPPATAVAFCHAPRAYGMGVVYCDQHVPPAGAWRSWPTRYEDTPASGAAGRAAGEGEGYDER